MHHILACCLEAHLAYAIVFPSSQHTAGAPCSMLLSRRPSPNLCPLPRRQYVDPLLALIPQRYFHQAYQYSSWLSIARNSCFAWGQHVDLILLNSITFFDLTQLGKRSKLSFSSWSCCLNLKGSYMHGLRYFSWNSNCFVLIPSLGLHRGGILKVVDEDGDYRC